MNQLADTNRTKMEHLSLTSMTKGSKYLAISGVRLGHKILMHTNQLMDTIDKQGHGDQNFLFASQKIGNGISIGF